MSTFQNPYEVIRHHVMWHSANVVRFMTRTVALSFQFTPTDIYQKPTGTRLPTFTMALLEA